MRRPPTSAAALLVLAPLTILPACSAAKDLDLAGDGTDTAESENDLTTLSQLLVGEGASGDLQPAAAPTGGDLTTAGIGDRAKALFQPAGCLAVVSDPAAKTVKYTFSSCTGPRGLTTVDGVVDVRWSATSATALHLDYTASKLRVNRGTYDWEAAADVVATSGTARTAHWVGHVAGTTGGGLGVDRTNDKNLAWDAADGCLQIDGTSRGTYGERHLATTVANFRKCRGACPESGGSFVLEDTDDGRKVTVSFDGSGRATITGSRNVTATVTLACSR